MKNLTFSYADGNHEDFTVDSAQVDAARTALAAQTAAHPIKISDKVTVYVNMRHVVTLATGDAPEGEGEGEGEDTPDLTAQIEALQAELDTERGKVEKLERENAALTVPQEQAQASSTPPLPSVQGEEAEYPGYTQPVAEPEAEPVAEPEAPAGEPESDDRTVAQLKEALDKAGVNYPSDARKADLQQLAREGGV